MSATLWGVFLVLIVCGVQAADCQFGYNRFYSSVDEPVSEFDEKIRLLDEKLTLQLKQQILILTEHIEQLERHIQELRHINMYDWNSTDSGSQYKVFTMKKSWDDAQLVCNAYGAALVVIDSDYKNAYVREILNDQIRANASEETTTTTSESEAAELWIGLKTKAEMSNGSVRYSNFYEEEKAEGCTIIDSQGKWKVRPCRIPHPFVCQKVNVR